MPEKHETADPVSATSKNATPLHRRLLSLGPVRYVRAFLANIILSLVWCFVLLLIFLPLSNLNLDTVLGNLRDRAVESLNFLFPEYYVYIEDITVDASPTVPGWASINDILLVDAVEERTIEIKSIHMSPSLWSIAFGNPKFDHLSANGVLIDFKLEPPTQDSELSIPISALDIPANILEEFADLEINDMTLRLVSSVGDELVSFRDLQSKMERNADGYVARISARQTNSQSGSFVFNVERDGENITWDGHARNYKLSPDSKISIEFDADLGFENVPIYDLTESVDNAAKPYQYLETGRGLFRVKGDELNAQAQYVYDPEKDALSVENMNLAVGEQSFVGNLDITLGDAIYLHGFDFGANYDGVAGPVNFGGGSFFSRLDLREQVIDIGEISFLNPYFHIYGRARGEMQPKPVFALDLRADDVNFEDLQSLWPKGRAEEQLGVIQERLKFDNIQDLGLWARYEDGFKAEVNLLADDIGIKVAEIFPLISGPQARINMTQDNFRLSASKADFVGFEDEMGFENVKFTVDDFFADTIRANTTFHAFGDVKALYAALNNEKFSMQKMTSFDADRVSGQFDADFDLNFPLLTKLNLQNMQMNVDGNLDNIVVKSLVSGKDLKLRHADLTMTQNDLRLEGIGNLAGIDARADFRRKMAKGSPAEIDLSGNVNAASLRQFGVSLPTNVKIGNLPVRAEVNLIRKGVIDFAANIDARELAMTYPGVGVVKSSNTPGKVAVEGQMRDNQLTQADFDIQLNNLKGRGDYSPSRGIRLPELYLKNYYQGEAYVQGRNVTLRNAFMDFRNLKFETSSADFPAWTINVENVNAKFPGDFSASQIYGFYRSGSNTQGEFTGLVGGRAPLKAQAWTEDGELNVQLLADDAGEVFRAANLYSGIRGGYLNIHLIKTKYPGLFAANLNVSNFALKNNSTAISLLQAASIFGVLDPNQLYFESLNADVLASPDNIKLFSGYAYGPSLGVTLGGTYNLKQPNADFFGVVTPAYLLNGAFQRIPFFGEVLGGNVGEGLFGVTYRVQGAPSNPNLQVNPLSILTPGRLRNIWGNVPQAAELPEELRVR